MSEEKIYVSIELKHNNGQYLRKLEQNAPPPSSDIYHQQSFNRFALSFIQIVCLGETYSIVGIIHWCKSFVKASLFSLSIFNN